MWHELTEINSTSFPSEYKDRDGSFESIQFGFVFFSGEKSNEKTKAKLGRQK